MIYKTIVLNKSIVCIVLSNDIIKPKITYWLLVSVSTSEKLLVFVLGLKLVLLHPYFPVSVLCIGKSR